MATKQKLDIPHYAPYSKQYPAHAKGGSLAEGLSHLAKAGDVDDMYKRDEGKQRPARDSDRING